MANRIPFAPEEWYHCFNRSIDKRSVFSNAREYMRFVQLLYICNSAKQIHRSDLYNQSTEQILQLQRGKPLVAIGAFCLMPNHFHLLLKERDDGGISTFMQKIGIAYAMYFNIKNKRTGNIFMRPFRSRHVSEDSYFQYVVNYIHCNPAELYEHGWKQGTVQNIALLEKKLLAYPYSSFGAHQDKKHAYRNILDAEVFAVANPFPVRKMLSEAAEYYEEVHVKMLS